VSLHDKGFSKWGSRDNWNGEEWELDGESDGGSGKEVSESHCDSANVFL
jgi:hypothetical protein